MANSLSVLIVEDTESDAKLIVRLLDKAGYKVVYQQVETAGQMSLALGKQAWDLVISDYSLPQFDGAAALTLLQGTGLDIPFIVVSGKMGEETAVAMMKAGAHDYLIKGHLARLVPAVERELVQSEERRKRRIADEELREIDKRFRAVIENSTDAITLLDAGGKVMFDSPVAPGMLGYTPDDWVEKETFQLIHPDDLPEIQSLFRKLVGSPGARENSTFRVRHKSGSWLWIEVVAKNLLAEPAMKAIVLNYRDITERKQAEEAIALSEARYRSLVETQAEVVSRSDLSGNLSYVNDSYSRVFGILPGQVLGMNFDQSIFPEDLPLVHEMLEAIKQPPYRKYVEIRNATVGGIRWFGWDSSAVLDDHGNVVELQGVGRDITERKQAEETIKLSEERFRTLYENNTLGLYRTTPDGRILLANPSLVRMLGYASFEELQARNLEQEGFEPSYSRSQFIELMEKQGEVQGLESAWERQDGTFIFVRESARAIRNPERAFLKSGCDHFEHTANAGDIHHRFTGVGCMLVVASQTTITAQPTKGALHNPAPRQDFESFYII